MKFRHLLLRKFSAIVVVLFLALPVLSFSAEVSEEVAQRVTANFLTHYVATYGNWAGSDSPATTDSQLVVYNDVPLAYNFRVSPSGHILVAYWDEFSPVLLYSTSSQFIPERVEENGSIESWIIPEIYSTYELIYKNRKFINEEISYGDTRVAKAWEWLDAGHRSFSRKAEDYGYKFATVGPLLSTTWAQGDPYNQQCPAVSGSCSHTKVGCVATAWSQVMKYWNWPTTGTGSHSYTWNGTTLSANFNTTYDWANMPNQLTASSTSTQKAAVAKLCYHVGVSADMSYGCSSSGSNAYANDALDVYFKYKSSMQKISRGTYTASQWFALFKTEFDASTPRPVVLSIFATNGGHEVVADGYQTGVTNKVHVNLGWSGSYDGYYDVTNNFTTGSYTWLSNSQVIVTHIEPDQSASNYVQEVLGSDINFPDFPVSHTDRIVGAPDNDLISLGSGGYVIVKMTQAITDGSGNDFKVYEVGSSLGGTSETYYVYGTSNCDSPTWTYIGSGSDVTSFELPSGLSSVQCLKLVDGGTSGGKVRGADFDAVEGLNSSSSSANLKIAIAGTTVTISVDPVPGAESYTLVYYTPAELSYIREYDMGTSTSESFELWSGAAFHVAVEANMNDGSGISTEFQSFHIPE